MSEHALDRILQEIEPLNIDARVQAQARLDVLTKPPGSLGRLEDLAVQYVSITGNVSPSLLNSIVFTLAADHGVTAEGVSAYPQSVTAQMVKNFLKDGAGVNVLARHAGASVCVVDMGVADDLQALPELVKRKIRDGTKNFSKESAMTQEQALQSIHIGIELAKTACGQGKNVIAVGEMGIGNTTASAAIVSVMTGQSVTAVTGRGTGVDDERLKHKVSVIEHALRLHRLSSSDALDVFTKVGGFEIGGMVGIILGAAACKVPVILDGFITGASALIAVALQPQCREYLMASHVSQEPGHRIALDHLKLEPLLDLRLRLGEGTGACLALTLLQAALKIYSEMATFEEANVDGALPQDSGSSVDS
jgi:nicotinate-nucleotide--dimethylbenzimidazole phosphoribosyltransferase